MDASHHLLALPIASGSRIAPRASSTIAHLTTAPPDPAKPPLVRLAAPAPAANKLISVVEIAKRHLAAHGRTVYQYNALSSVLGAPRRAARVGATRTGGDGEDDGGGEDDADADAFQTIGTTRPQAPQRLVPVLTTYLSLCPVHELRRLYG